MVGINVFLNCNAVSTGMMRRADIRSTPTIGIAKDIVIADRIMKIVLIRFTFILSTFAASSSKVMNSSFLKMAIIETITTKLKMLTV